jgi:hypothetical protein
MNQEVATSDIIIGVIVLVIFLFCALAVGRFLSTLKNRRFTQAWAPLITLINGKVVHDGGGAATSWLTGTYQGKSVQASMIPDRNKYQEEGSDRYNYFDVAFVDLPGQRDWRIVYKTSVLGMGTTGWQIEAANPALGAQLQEMDIIPTLSRWGSPTIEYSARKRTLSYSEDITPRWVPTPERFGEELQLLLQLAQLNEQMNLA